MSYIETKQLITDAKNICVIPSQTNEPESTTCALALFYTLKELHKNVNLIIDNLPEKLSFLVPSLDFISSPKNFVISIPRSAANISQIYYEKNEENLKIHLTVDHGSIKKDNIALYATQALPDLVITLGIRDFQKELQDKLDSFGFLLGVPIINIDNNEHNTKFGQINIIESQSISETTFNIIKSLDENLIKRETANCILTGLASYYENFKNARTSPEILKTAVQLMEKGANYGQITENLYKTTPAQMEFLTEIFKNLQNEEGLYVATLASDQFQSFGREQARDAMEKINGLGLQNDMLVLWNSHTSTPMVKGFFHSQKQHLLNRVAESQGQHINKGWVFLLMPESDINSAKEKIIKLLF